MKTARVMTLWMVIGTAKIARSEYLIGHLWEAVQAMRVKFLWETYDHLGYPHTEFCPIPKGLCAKLWWTDMELPLCQFVHRYKIQHTTCSPLFPQSNGTAECAVQSSKHLDYSPADLYKAWLAYRNSLLEKSTTQHKMFLHASLEQHWQ